MIARLSAYDSMSFPVPTPAFIRGLGDDTSNLPDDSESLTDLDLPTDLPAPDDGSLLTLPTPPLQIYDSSGLTPAETATLNNLPINSGLPGTYNQAVTPQTAAGNTPAASLLAPAVAVSEPSMMQQILNAITGNAAANLPTTSLVPSPAVSSTVGTSSIPNISTWLDEQTLLTGYSNGEVLAGGAGALIVLPILVRAITGKKRRR